MTGDGARIHHTDEGRAPALVPLPGSSGSRRTHDGVVARLQRLYRAIRYDEPNMGLFGPAPFIVGLFLQLYGDLSGQMAAGQPASVIAAVRIAMGVLPMNAYGVAVLMLVTLYCMPDASAPSTVPPAH